MPLDQVKFLDVRFDLLSIKRVTQWLSTRQPDLHVRYVVTPNVDHVVRMHREPELRLLYDNADLCVCDSRVLSLLAKWSGIHLPVVPGSDICGLLFSKVIEPGDKIAVVGMRSTVARLRAMFPQVMFVHYDPPWGLRQNKVARHDIAKFVSSTGARFTFLAVGSPQQEMIARELKELCDATGTVLCIGAGLEFLTRERRRAPRWMQERGLEWVHRLFADPRRLWRRYLIDGLRIFPLYLKTSWPASSLFASILRVRRRD